MPKAEKKESNVAKRDEALAKIDGYFDDGHFERELARRIAFKTESNLAGCETTLASYLEDEMVPNLTALGFSCEIYPNPRQDAGPFLVARRQEGDDLPTVMTYGHGDVVAGYDDQWDNDMSPWEITKLDNRWYGRGTADNKGQHTINIAALRSVLETRESLGFNVIFLVEMGEERGSPGLKEFCTAHKDLFQADVFIASDGPRIHPEKPTIFLGSRGVFNFIMRLDIHDGGHHSGNWGGLLTNPGVIMAHAISSMIDKNGKILVKGWRNTKIPSSVRAAIAKLEVGGGENAPQINPNWGEPDLSLGERVFASNTFEIRAFETGNPKSPANAIPPSAVVYGHLRYVVGTDVDQLMPLLRVHLDRHGFQDIEIIGERDPMYATRLDPEHPWVRWAIASLNKTNGASISVMPNLGGSLPNDVFADVLSLPTIWVPHSYAGCSQHAPNEHILEETSKSALRLMTGLWWDLGAGNTPKNA